MSQANALCCTIGLDGQGAQGYGRAGVGLPSLGATIKPAKGQTLAQTVEQALQAALHGSASVASSSSGISGGPVRGAQVIAFPTIDPYRPLKRTGVGVAGYTAFPAPVTNVQPNRAKRLRVRSVSIAGGVRSSFFNVRGTENVGAPATSESKSGFVDISAQIPPGISLTGFGDAFDELGAPPPVPIYRPASPTKLQTILGAISTTLPATVQAWRASPQNIFPGQAVNPYATTYPVTGTGRAAEDVGAGVGRAADTLGYTVSQFVANHPYLVIGGGAALFLLFMNPPRRR